NGTKKYPHVNFVKDPLWMSWTWHFYDENADLRSITVKDVLAMSQNMRYLYTDPISGDPAPEPSSSKPAFTVSRRPKEIAEIHAVPEPEKTILSPAGIMRSMEFPADFRQRVLDSARPES